MQGCKRDVRIRDRDFETESRPKLWDRDFETETSRPRLRDGDLMREWMSVIAARWWSGMFWVTSRTRTWRRRISRIRWNWSGSTCRRTAMSRKTTSLRSAASMPSSTIIRWRCWGHRWNRCLATSTSSSVTLRSARRLPLDSATTCIQTARCVHYQLPPAKRCDNVSRWEL